MADDEEQKDAHSPASNYLRAGRAPEISSFVLGESGEERHARIYREVLEDNARSGSDRKGAGRPDPASIPAGVETAQQTFARFLREGLGPRLRSLGLRGSRGRFHIDRGELKGWVQFLRYRYSNKALVKFTIDIWVTYLPTGIGFWGDRIGPLMPDIRHNWWVVPAGADTSELIEEVLVSIRDYGLVAIQAAMNLYPPVPNRLWARSFHDPIQQWRPNVLGDKMTFPASVEEAFSSVSDPNFVTRSNALYFLYSVAADDPRFAPVLASFLEREPRTVTRATAARMLGFINCDPAFALPALRAAVAEDQDLAVRISAAYAVRLIERGTRDAVRAPT